MIEVCDFTDMEQEQQQQQWTSTPKQLINEYQMFYENMGLLINKIESNGPTGKFRSYPKKLNSSFKGHLWT
jgi:hypothetical protein